MKRKSAIAYCTDLIKQTDRPRYVSGLLLRNSHAHFAVRALNSELASAVGSIADASSRESYLARLMWWKTALIDLTSGQAPLEHPVLQCLKPLNLKRSFLTRMVDARIEEANRVGSSMQFGTVDQLEAFGENVYSSMHYLILQANNVKSVDYDHFASHLGKSAYISLVLRGVGYHARNRQSFLPVDLMASKRLSQEALFSGDIQSDERLHDCVFELAARGREHLIHLKEIANVEHETLTMERALLWRFYEQLEKVNFNVLQMSSDDPMLPFHLLRAKMNWIKY